MTNKTPLRIKNEPIQNVPPICSPSRIHPSKVPTRGWKKKKRPPLEAFNNCKPRFHNKKAQAVETIPKYKRPPRILGSSSSGVKIVLGFTKGVSATMATKVEYVVTSIGE